MFVIVARGCVIVARDLPQWHTKNVFTWVRFKQCAWNLHQSCLTSRSIDFKKNQPKPIIRKEVIVPNVQKYVMVETLTLRENETIFMWKTKPCLCEKLNPIYAKTKPGVLGVRARIKFLWDDYPYQARMGHKEHRDFSRCAGHFGAGVKKLIYTHNIR